MKKDLFIMLLLLISMSTALAASSSFSDVPADHWAYKAIHDLANAGLIDGYTYEGNKPMSRYEMAVLVAKAGQNQDKANNAQKLIINSLKTEFGAEIKDINVSVTPKSDKKQPDFHIGGDLRFRYYSNLGLTGNNQGGKSTHVIQDRIRVIMGATIDDRWAVNARIGAQYHDNRSNWGTTSGALGSSTGTVQMDQAELVYKMNPNWSATYGRSGMFLGTTGAIADSTFWDGATLKYSDNKFTGRLLAYDISQALLAYMANNTTSTKVNAQNVKGLDLKYQFSPKVTVTADYLISDNLKKITDSTSNGYNSSLPWNILAVGATVKLSPDYTFKAEFVDNRAAFASANAPAEGEGFYTAINYKQMDIKKPGTYSIGVHYQAWGKDTINGMLMGGLTSSNTTYGTRGWGVSYDYTLAKDIFFSGKCDWLTPYDTSVNNFKFSPAVSWVLITKF